MSWPEAAPDMCDLVIRRHAHALDWCATSLRKGTMPGAVFADIVMAHMMEAKQLGIWGRVRAGLMARGHIIFGQEVYR